VLVRQFERGRRGAGDDCTDSAERGQFLECRGRGAGVFELKIKFGPGYRVYFGKDGARIVVLGGRSAKRRQSAAIASAQTAWAGQKRRKGGTE